jgi:hypothetical protein
MSECSNHATSAASWADTCSVAAPAWVFVGSEQPVNDAFAFAARAVSIAMTTFTICEMGNFLGRIFHNHDFKS